MTRLLNTPIVTRWPIGFTPSSIDMLGGLSQMYIVRKPPRFCAETVPLAEIAISNALAAAAARRFISCPPFRAFICRARRLPCASRCRAADHCHETLADKAQLGAIKGSLGK